MPPVSTDKNTLFIFVFSKFSPPFSGLKASVCFTMIIMIMSNFHILLYVLISLEILFIQEDSHENDHEDKEKEKTDATDEKQQNETDDVETTKLVEKEAEFSLPNENPVIAALPQIATESAEGEEMELTGDKKTDAKETLDFTRDENLFKVSNANV